MGSKIRTGDFYRFYTIFEKYDIFKNDTIFQNVDIYEIDKIL